MLAVGRPLMACPQLLLLDERSLGLAPRIVGLMFEAVGKIAAASRRATPPDGPGASEGGHA
jgi:branched-chain amino acid transport system ATP-binding protein